MKKIMLSGLICLAVFSCTKKETEFDALYVAVYSEEGTTLDEVAFRFLKKDKKIVLPRDPSAFDNYKFTIAGRDLSKDPFLVRLDEHEPMTGIVSLAVLGMKEAKVIASEVLDQVDLSSKGLVSVMLTKSAGECDNDRDGFETCKIPGCCKHGRDFEDCDDNDPQTNPFVYEDSCFNCAFDEITAKDRDCDGQKAVCNDEDLDGAVDCLPKFCLKDGESYEQASCRIYEEQVDCDPNDPHVYPFGPELCDQKDNDCDGNTDEDGPYVVFKDFDGKDKKVGQICGTGACANGIVVCENFVAVCSTHSLATKEDCKNGADDDCDGLTDSADLEDCAHEDTDGDGVPDILEDEMCSLDAKFHSEIFPEKDKDGKPTGAVHRDSEPCCKGWDGFSPCPFECDWSCDGKCSMCDTNDKDGDGFPEDIDCNDDDPQINPSSFERCGDGIDNDCSMGDAPCSLGIDRDGDGYFQGFGDCNDSDPKVHPFALEVCNGVDDDCDGYVDEGNPGGGNKCGEDIGECKDKIEVCVPVIGEVLCLWKIGPTEEVCDDKDNDCDGQTDEEGAKGCIVFYEDQDGDGFGKDGASKCLCAPQDKYSAVNGGDCDDSDPTVYPGAQEICNGKDDDCNGTPDDEDAQNCVWFYEDKDRDTFGSANKKCLCRPEGDFQATRPGDCDDNMSSVNPSAKEDCNRIDDDCDGETDEDLGTTVCGAGLCQVEVQNCIDGKWQTCVPRAGETEKCDGLDNDCDGETDEGENIEGCTVFYKDVDNDGFGIDNDWKCLCFASGSYRALNGGDCDDNDNTIFPQVEEICDEKDNDCDGEIDEESALGCVLFYADLDEDGFGGNESRCLCKANGVFTALVSGDCNDDDSTVNPAAQERCNQVDDDCDGSTDEEGALGCLLFYRDSDRDGYGSNISKCLCSPLGYFDVSVSGDCDDNDKLINPGVAEKCNDKDDDCDGLTDEDWPNKGELCTVGAGACQAVGQWVCKADSSGVECNATPSGAKPEKCNNQDDDCDGSTDEGCDDDLDGYCDATMQLVGTPLVCENGGGDCDDNDPLIHPSALERCDGKDNDCDGLTDEEGAVGCISFYKDSDNDGFGVSNDKKCLCSSSSPYTVALGGDCNDNDASIYPGAVESCNSKDDDCDNQTDEENASGCRIYFYDGDQDNFGDTSKFKCLCSAGQVPKYTMQVGGDCNDENNQINPGATERCNGTDDDCDGQTDEEGAQGCTTYYLDSDNDTYGVDGNTRCLCSALGNYRATRGGDCNDNDTNINPGATEKCNYKDDNCNGQTDEAWPTKGQRCDGNDSDQCKEGIWVCKADGSGVECTDTSGDTKETCNNGVDDDCDGTADENEENLVNCSIFYYDGDNDGYGVSNNSKCFCSASGNYRASRGGDCNDSDASINPSATESCNAKDDDCDEQIDEEGAQGCTIYYYDNDNDEYGVTGNAKCLCSASGNYRASRGGDCDDSDASINPSATESCNNKDDDCDGQTDEEGAQNCTVYYYDEDRDSYGLTANSKCLCSEQEKYTATQGGDCDDNDSDINPGKTEVCNNNKDDDCDGLTDEQDCESP